MGEGVRIGIESVPKGNILTDENLLISVLNARYINPGDRIVIYQPRERHRQVHNPEFDEFPGEDIVKFQSG